MENVTEATKSCDYALEAYQGFKDLTGDDTCIVGEAIFRSLRLHEPLSDLLNAVDPDCTLSSAGEEILTLHII